MTSPLTLVSLVHEAQPGAQRARSRGWSAKSASPTALMKAAGPKQPVADKTKSTMELKCCFVAEPFLH